jgi:hypothetical protein
MFPSFFTFVSTPTLNTYLKPRQTRSPSSSPTLQGTQAGGVGDEGWVRASECKGIMLWAAWHAFMVASDLYYEDKFKNLRVGNVDKLLEWRKLP